MCNRIKAEVGWVVGFGLDQLPIVGFKGVHLGRFASKPKLVCEEMGSGFVKGDLVMDADQVRDPGWVPRFSLDCGSASSPEDAEGPQARLVTSPSMVNALSSFAIGDFVVQQSGSSQLRFAFVGGCVLAPVVTLDSVLVLALEDVAQPSHTIENPITQRFVFLPLSTSSSDSLFSTAMLFALRVEMLSSASLEVSLRSEGSSSALEPRTSSTR